MARRLPKFLRVSGMRIPVREEMGLEHQHEHGSFSAYGVYDPGIQSISLDMLMSPERRKVTLVHEALHAMLNASNIVLEEDDEEMLVGRMAPQLLNFLRSNESAILYLQEDQP